MWTKQKYLCSILPVLLINKVGTDIFTLIPTLALPSSCFSIVYMVSRDLGSFSITLISNRNIVTEICELSR